MAVVEESIDIRAPARAVFQAITDPRRAPEWNPSIVEIRDVTYPLGPGASWVQIVSVMGRMLTLCCTIELYDPPTYGELSISGDQQARLWTRCEERGSITRVTHGIDFASPGGPLGGVAQRFMKGMMQRELQQTVIRQRDTLERESGGSHGSGA